jgi:G:T/U-mismatch repair DNA glycosylase
VTAFPPIIGRNPRILVLGSLPERRRLAALQPALRERRAPPLYLILPSTSPANASFTYQSKLERWRQLEPHCRR